MRKITLIAALVGVLALPQAQADFGVGLSYGSLGRSISLGYNVNSAVGVRLNLTNGTTSVFSTSFYNNGTNGVLVDFYPTLTLSNFRIAGGIYDVDIDIANLRLKGTAPYLGLGLGRYTDDRIGLYFNGDIGLIFSKARASSGKRGIEGVVRNLHDSLGAYPVISFGMSFTF